MGKTNKQKMEQRNERLKQLPRSERLAKSALIKKKEGRVLDSSEKHALKMTSEYGEIMRLWEQLRTLPQTDERKSKLAKADAEDAGEENAVTEDEKIDNGSNPKFKVVKKLYKVIFPKFDSMARTPKISRVLQSCVKYGSNHQLMSLSTELAKQFVTYSTDAYAHHIVCAMFRHVPHAHYNTLLKLVLVNMPSLVTHKFGMLVVNAAYTNKLCSQADRNMCILGVFKDSVAVMKGWPGYPVIEDILSNDGDHKKRLVETLFKLVDKLVSQKEAYELPFVQRMVSAFIRYGNKSEVMEMCITLKPQIIKLMATKEGSELASLVFSLLQPKSRKEVLVQIRDNFVELACDKHAAPVIARMFDLVYDGQLLYKFLSAQLIDNMSIILRSPYAHLIILHLITPEEARKRRALFPNWFDYNLYYNGNEEWNVHHWLDDLYQKETVEICGKDASRTHMMILPPIMRQFFEVAAAEKDVADFPKHFVARVAKEIHHLLENEPVYAEALQVSEDEAALLEELLPNTVKRERDAEEGDDSAKKGSAKRKAEDDSALKKKRVRQEESTPAKKTPVKKAATPKQASTPKAAATPKSAVKATPKAQLTDSDAPVASSARMPVGESARKTPSGSAKKTPQNKKAATPVSASSKKKSMKFGDE